MIAWLFETLLATTCLMLVVLALRRPVARMFGPRIAYTLWALPVLRMILPPLPEAVVATASITPLPLAVQHALPLVRVPRAVATPVDWTQSLAALWSAGALACLILAVIGYLRFVRRLRANAANVGSIDGLTIWASPMVDGPLAFGIVTPGVALPADYAARYAQAELELALRHEAMHHERGDIIANTVALVVRAVHWFNPVAWAAHRAFRADQELACDAAVLARGAPGERHAYACALVKSATGRLPAAASAMNGKGQLKRRLGMMSRKGNSLARTLAGGTAVAALTLAGLALTASGSLAADQVRAAPQRLAAAIAPVVPITMHAPSVPAVPMVPSVPALAPAAPPPAPSSIAPPDAPEAPEAVQAPEPPEAPEAPEPPEMPNAAQIDAMVNSALADASASVAQARAQMARCRARHDAKACGDVDMREIRREVIAGLREAQHDLRDETMPRDIRARVLASLDAAIARMERDPNWR